MLWALERETEKPADPAMNHENTCNAYKSSLFPVWICTGSPFIIGRKKVQKVPFLTFHFGEGVSLWLLNDEKHCSERDWGRYVQIDIYIEETV